VLLNERVVMQSDPSCDLVWKWLLIDESTRLLDANSTFTRTRKLKEDAKNWKGRKVAGEEVHMNPGKPAERRNSTLEHARSPFSPTCTIARRTPRNQSNPSTALRAQAARWLSDVWTILSRLSRADRSGT